VTIYECKSCGVKVEQLDDINKTERGTCCECLAEKALKGKLRAVNMKIIHVFDEVWA